MSSRLLVSSRLHRGSCFFFGAWRVVASLAAWQLYVVFPGIPNADTVANVANVAHTPVKIVSHDAVQMLVMMVIVVMMVNCDVFPA